MNLTESKATRKYQSMNIRPLCCIFGTVVLLAACGESEPPREPSEIVTERAQARWDAVIAGDPESSYEYQTPGYREKTSVMDHVIRYSRRQITWLAADVLEAECTQDRCDVEIMVAYRADGAPGVLSGLEGSRPVEETWIRIDNRWWFVNPK